MAASLSLSLGTSALAGGGVSGFLTSGAGLFWSGSFGAGGASLVTSLLPYSGLFGSAAWPGDSSVRSCLITLLTKGIGDLVIISATTTAMPRPTIRPRMRPRKVPPACLRRFGRCCFTCVFICRVTFLTERIRRSAPDHYATPGAWRSSMPDAPSWLGHRRPARVLHCSSYATRLPDRADRKPPDAAPVLAGRAPALPDIRPAWPAG